MNRIDKKFKELKKNKQKALIIFITAGFPDLKTTKSLTIKFAELGVDLLELGIPFSDPIADGPIIQNASNYALKNKVSLKSILNLVKDLRKNIDIPLILMGYYNPIFTYGVGKFIKEAKMSGVDGVIIPDLPLEENLELERECRKSGLDNILLVAPTTSLKRMKTIACLAQGFIYYISITGITGIRKKLPEEIFSQIKQLHRFTKKPICVGFGISNPKQAKKISNYADGVIIGSAVIKIINDNLGNNKKIIERTSKLVKCISEAVHVLR
jgi:tryptophan synthase alpha chain